MDEIDDDPTGSYGVGLVEVPFDDEVEVSITEVGL